MARGIRVPWAREKECKGRAPRGLERMSENLRGACWVEGPLKERLDYRPWGQTVSWGRTVSR